MTEWASLLPQKNFSRHKFPAPQYLGAKYIHRHWINNFIPAASKKILDAFSGSQSIAYMCKQSGKQVLTNDFLKFNYLLGMALVENPGFILSAKELALLLSENSDPEKFNLMETLFTDLFFIREDARFADSVRSNIELLPNPYHRALAMAIMCRSMTRKVTMGHFAHTRALQYSADPQRVKRNRSLALPLKLIFLSLVDEYNAAVFNNNQENRSFNENIVELLPRLDGVDVAYFDPPYCDSHADYQSFYHLLETFAHYWKDKKFLNRTKRYAPKKYSGFDKKGEFMKNLRNLFDLADPIPLWLVSYNDRSYPGMEEMIALLASRRKVRIEKRPYLASRGGKGSVAGSAEYLLICRR